MSSAPVREVVVRVHLDFLSLQVGLPSLFGFEKRSSLVGKRGIGLGDKRAEIRFPSFSPATITKFSPYLILFVFGHDR